MADDYTQNTSTSQLHDNTIIDVTVTQSHCSASGSSNSEASAGSKIKPEIEIGARDHEDDVIIVSHSVSESESVKHERDQNSKRNQGFGGSPNDDASPLPLMRSSISKISKPVKSSDANLGGRVKERMNSANQSMEERDGSSPGGSLGMSGNAGVLAPSSLTPSSLNASSDERRRVTSSAGARGSGDLPNRMMMANVFRGKRTKKRPPSPVELSLSAVTGGEEERSAKRRRCEELDARSHAANEVPAVGPVAGGSKAGGLVAGSRESSKVKVSVATVPGKNKRTDVRDLLDLGGSLASEMEQEEVVGSSRSFTSNRKQEDKGKPMLELAQSISIQSDSSSLIMDQPCAAPLPQSESEFNPEREAFEYLENSEVRSKDDVRKRDRSPLTQRTPAKTLDVSCSSFLSARGARSKKALLQESSGETSQACGFNTQASAANSSLNGTPSAGASFSALTLNHDKEVLPLTAVSRGHRSKATPSRMSVADAMWLEEEQSGAAVGRVDGRSSDGEEEEDPFEGEEGEMLPSQCFEPVRDSEGFIRAREVPQLKVSVDSGPADFYFRITISNFNVWLKFDNMVTCFLPTLSKQVTFLTSFRVFKERKSYIVLKVV